MPGCSRSAAAPAATPGRWSGPACPSAVPTSPRRFVALLRADGFEADLVDPLIDDLADPAGDAPYDGVWAAASLLHVRREDLPRVLANLAAATRPGGLLQLCR